MKKIITTTKGAVEGVEKNGYVVFKGIPYAKAPIGELRWKEPQEVEAWKGTYKADTFGTLGRCWRPMTEHDYELSEEMVTCWTNFMKTGNPNGDGQALQKKDNWESYTKEYPYVKVFK